MTTGKLYLGNLSYDTTEHSVRNSFEKYGAVTDVHIVTDRDSGRPRGFAFVTFAEVQDAEDAVKAMDGVELDGRTIKVNHARPREDRPRGGGRGRGGGGGYRRSYGGGSDRYGSDRYYGGGGDRYGDRNGGYDSGGYGGGGYGGRSRGGGGNYY